MKKKIFGTILAAALVVSQAVTVFAAGSKVGEASLAGDNAGQYTMTAITSSVDGGESASMEAILAGNANPSSLQAVADVAPDLADELAGKEAITPFFDLTSALATEDGYAVTLSVSSLTSAMTDVKLLHYSTVRSLWEIVEPTNVDYANKLISAEFEDLSPVAVIANTGAAASDGAEGTSPQTGMTSNWMVWLGAAVVLAAAGVVTYRKARQ